MHFSSFHKYETDSFWANKFTTPENDLERGWDKKIGFFKQFSSIAITSKGFKKINSTYPSLNDINILTPDQFGDDWSQEASKKDIKLIKNYLIKIEKVSRRNFGIKIGTKVISLGSENSDKQSFIICAPRNSLVRAIRSNIFDDLLIGNFARLILPVRKKINYKKTLKIASKYIDNIGIKDAYEFKQFLWLFRNSYDSKQEAIKCLLKNKAKN